jgi:glycerol-3-phosphate dehydrogenase
VAPNSAKIPPEFSFRTREHFWQHLKNYKDLTANVVVIGGGIVGAGVVRELALQGIPLVFLFEKNDFASGTSWASSKLIHAGIRYLETAWTHIKKFRLGQALRNFAFVVEASHERKVLRNLAPHLVKPKPIYLVLGEDDERSPLSVALGVWLYYGIQLLQGQIFPRPKVVFRKDAIRWMAPELNADRVKAIFSFWDSETDDARLVIENLQAAHELGSYAMNYVELLSYREEGEELVVELKNRENGQTLSLRTKILINATGAFVDEVRSRGRSDASHFVDRVAGAHIDVYPALTKESYYVTAGDGRLVFFLTRNEDGLVYSRVGTTERPLSAAEPSEPVVASEKEVSYLINLVKEYLPGARIEQENMVRIDAGIRPLRAQKTASAFQKSREHEIIVEKNVYHMVGVKLTDFRRVANELLLKIPWEKLNLRLTDSGRSEDRPLREVESERMYVETDIIETIRRTMVLHWKDYVERRRGVGPEVLRRIEPGAYEREFTAMKDVLGWDEEKARRERASV